MPMKAIVYIDPQSYKNLSIYDFSLLSCIAGKIHYICSANYDYLPLPPHVIQHKLFNYNNKRSNLEKAVSYLWSYLCISILLIWWRPKAVHIQWLRIPKFDVVFLRTIKKLIGCRIVFTAHNILPHQKGHSQSDQRDAYDKMYKLADAIIVHTNITKRELISTFGVDEGKVAVIEHGLLSLTYDSALLNQQIEQLNAHYGISQCIVFSALGFQYAYKGVDMLAEVWASTPELRNNPSCKLLFIGKNRGVDLSAANGIENVMIEDREVSDEEFYYLLTHTSVHVLPYRKISQSGLLMSAITCGTPVLVTKTGGLTEPFETAQIGWTIPANDATALREKLLWLVRHPEEIIKVKNNDEAWEKVRRRYSWSRIGEKTTLLY